ncbi:MAG: dihydropyrimidinase [Clostridia bacterium]
MKTLISNGIVVNANGSKKMDVLVENGWITAVGEGLCAQGAELIDAAECYVFPGFIDTHTHLDLDTGSAVTADNFATGTAAALLGGTTTVLDFATQDRGGTLATALNTWHKKAAGSSCNYGFHMAIATWNDCVAQEFKTMADEGIVSYKMYMVYDALRVDDGTIYSAMKYARRFGALIGMHCENWDVLQRMIIEVKANGFTGPQGHPLSRPAEVEAEAVARYLRIAQLAGAPAYVVHLSTAEGLNEALRARARGQRVYLETCPQYLLLTDERYAQADAGKFVMSPPLRKSTDNNALWHALMCGELDTIGTDHCSFTMAQKAMGADDFTKIPNGGAGLQHRAQLIYTYGVKEGRLSMEQMAGYLSTNAARLFGMPERGEIAPGKAADIVVWENREGCITDTNTAHNCDNSPFAGFKTLGAARDVLLNGQHVVRDGQLIARGMGKYIHRSRCYQE